MDDPARPRASAARSPSGRSSTARTTSIPDNPKGYQISQYDQPLCVDGSFDVPGADGDRVVGIERAHLEEDAAKTIHVGGAEGRIHGAEHSLVDFNRCGHAARRDRDQARHPLARGGEGVPAAAAADGRRARDLGRGDGEGLAAVRRQRLGAAGGLGRAAHAHRAEEHELVQLRRQGDRARGARGRSRSTSPAARSTRRRSTSTRATSRRRRCARRRRRRTTATSRSPTSCRSSPPESSSSACAASCRSCRRRGSGGSRREVGFALAEGLVTSGRDELYSRIAGRAGTRSRTWS